MRVLMGIIVIGLSIGWLAHFTILAMYGTILVSEPNKVILYGEIAFFIALAGFGFYRCCMDYRRRDE